MTDGTRLNASPDSGSDREHWGSRFGFVMATAGFVGLGNIWRFPYLAGENGGGAFLIVYVAFAVLIGIPLMTAEISLGRKSRLSPIAGMRKLTGSSTSPWNLLGWIGVTTAVLIHAVREDMTSMHISGRRCAPQLTRP